jgi:uncharacterized membrane protein (UPF0127 family)
MLQIRNLTKDTMLAGRAEVADTSRKRRTGLLKHSSLPAGEGLWIAPCEAVHTFFMKFPIDVVFLNKKRKVLGVRENVRPGRLAICLRAYSVLELPAGACARTSTAAGDQLEFGTIT